MTFNPREYIMESIEEMKNLIKKRDKLLDKLEALDFEINVADRDTEESISEFIIVESKLKTVNSKIIKCAKSMINDLS